MPTNYRILVTLMIVSKLQGGLHFKLVDCSNLRSINSSNIRRTGRCWTTRRLEISLRNECQERNIPYTFLSTSRASLTAQFETTRQLRLNLQQRVYILNDIHLAAVR